jgi:glycosyltransferase involved in cell wall biosynthesis
MSAQSLPSVSIVVPAYNEGRCIGACVASLLAQDYPPELLRVIVVDNGSTDDTFDRLQEIRGVLALREERAGSYAARNRGLQHVDSDIVCFTDADCTARPDWVRNAVRHLVDGSVGVVAGHVEIELPQQQCASALFEKLFAFRQAENVRRNRCVTANWCSPSRLVQEHGGFDAALRSGGDWKLAGQIAASGYRIVFAPDAIVHHPARTSRAQLLHKKRRQVGGMYARDYLSGRRTLARLWWILAREPFRSLRVIWAASGLRLSARLRVTGMLFLSCTVGILELLRLRCGGEALR